MATLSTVLPASEARANFYKILEEVDKYGEQFTITHRGKLKAVIMSADELEGWKETLEIQADNKLVQSINRGLKSKKRYTLEEAYKILGWNKKK